MTDITVLELTNYLCGHPYNAKVILKDFDGEQLKLSNFYFEIDETLECEKLRLEIEKLKSRISILENKNKFINPPYTRPPYSPY